MAVSSSPELFLVAVSVVAREAAGSVIGAGRCAIGGKHNGDEAAIAMILFMVMSPRGRALG